MEIINLDIDYLRFNFSDKANVNALNKFYEGLSENSPVKFLSIYGFEFELSLITVRSERIIMFRYLGDSVIELKKYNRDSGSIFDLEFSITFYSSFFMKSELRTMLNSFIQKNLDSISISRIDICIDIPMTTNDFLGDYTQQDGFKNVMTTSRRLVPWFSGQKVETVYFGKKGSKKHFIRVYDKLLDTRVKGKSSQYSAYFELYEAVTRIELQANILTVKAYSLTPNDVISFYEKSDTRLHKFFAAHVKNSQSTYFTALTDADISSTVAHKTPKMSLSNKALSSLDYARRMLGYAKRLKEDGFDVIGYLNQELYNISTFNQFEEVDGAIKIA